MPGVWQRHPRYSLLVAVVLVTTLYLLVPVQHDSLAPPLFTMKDNDLPNRMERANSIYDKMLVARKGLIKKFGPSPKDIALFPEPKKPWPPYTVWDFFPPAFNCPHEVERHGALGDGGKWVCGLSRLREKRDCVVYSFGINYESSFEAEILRNTRHCQIWGYDFSVKSFGPEIPPESASRTHFKAYGLAGQDDHGPEAEHPMYTLASLMKMNDHEFIDVLKIDIEGWEFDTLTTLIKPYLDSGKPLPFAQLQLEVHAWHKTFENYLQWWEMLEEAGLRPFWTEPNMVYVNYNRDLTADLAEYSFLNIKGDNIFIKDPRSSIDSSDHTN